MNRPPGPDQVDERCRERWADGGAGGPGEQEAAAHADHLVGLGEVGGVGHRDRVEGERRAAQQEEQRQQPRAGPGERRGHRQGCHGKDTARDHQPPVEPVGEPAQRPLADEAAELERGEQPDHHPRLQADPGAVDRRQAEQRAVEKARGDAAGDGGRGEPVELARAQDLEPRGWRLLGAGERHRDQRQREHGSGDLEPDRRGGVDLAQQQLAADDRDLGGDQVERQDAAAGLRGCRGAQPALDHREQPRLAEAHRHPQDEPQRHELAGREHHAGDGADRGKDGEGPDMADVTDQPRGDDAAGEEAQPVA